MPRFAYLALGSNLGDRERALREAIARISAARGVNFSRASRVYETAPVGPVEQPAFLNMVIEVEVGEEVSARDLLKLAKQIESDLGRQRRERWGPREIDVDILWIEGEQVEEPDFRVPHPEMWERAFVMAPLADLAPEMRTPSGERVREAAERLRREQGVDAYLSL